MLYCSIRQIACHVSNYDRYQAPVTEIYVWFFHSLKYRQSEYTAAFRYMHFGLYFYLNEMMQKLVEKYSTIVITAITGNHLSRLVQQKQDGNAHAMKKHFVVIKHTLFTLSKNMMMHWSTLAGLIEASDWLLNSSSL